MRTVREPAFCVAFSLIVILILSGVLGCATLGGKDNENRLRERVEAYWQARMKGDIEGQYQLEDVAATKQASLLQYAKKKPVAEILGYQIEEILINPEKTEASVRLSVDYKWVLAGIPRNKTTSSMTEDWVFISGDWYRKHRVMSLHGK